MNNTEVVLRELLNDIKELQKMHDYYPNPEDMWESEENLQYDTYQTCIDIIELKINRL